MSEIRSNPCCLPVMFILKVLKFIHAAIALQPWPNQFQPSSWSERSSTDTAAGCPRRTPPCHGTASTTSISTYFNCHIAIHCTTLQYIAAQFMMRWQLVDSVDAPQTSINRPTGLTPSSVRHKCDPMSDLAERSSLQNLQRISKVSTKLLVEQATGG